MGGERRAEKTQAGVPLELAEDVEHMVGVLADVFVADIAEAAAHAARLGLHGLFVVHEAGIVIPGQAGGQVAEEGRHVPAAVFHHQHRDAVQRQRGEGRLDRRLLFLGIG